ncbi:hypothetical protein [Streptomyces sp. MBT62]|uniref:hypothetical protein n=1 Tax=Streptomyces sp. MBT62 TaxID=2800410 RepID=UPI00190D41A2|nr:hypothetical protein [Streptomyces sp. MBT62]MBK3571825.1 hypothetical protein [Streptomyces sp. MBT62]
MLKALARVGHAAAAGLRALGVRTVAMIAAALAVVLAVIVTGFVLSRHDSRPPVPASGARHSTGTEACLLTDRQGIKGSPAATVWRGMQDASLRTHTRVSHSSVTGEQSTANARPFLDAMLRRSCEVVLAVGGVEVKAVQETVGRHANVGFVLVGSGSGSADRTATNVSWVPIDDGLRAAVTAAVERVVDAQQ